MEKKKWGSKILAVLLAAFMLAGTLPASAFPAYASQTDTPSDMSGTVYLTYSHDGVIAKDSDGSYMVNVPVEIEDIAVQDYSEILGWDYVYDADDDGEDEITIIKAFLYALDYYGPGTRDISLEGSGGSMYVSSGLWNYDDGTPWDENLLYYYNGMYPLKEEGLGATGDQVPLHDGDIISVLHSSDWNFYFDAAAGFIYFGNENFANAGYAAEAGLDADFKSYIATEFQAVAGETLEVPVAKSWGFGGGETKLEAYSDVEVCVGSYLYSEECQYWEVTDGKASITFDAEGDYYIWTTASDTQMPAVAKVHVEAAPIEEDDHPAIIAPAGSTISVGYQTGYFKKTWIDPIKTETLSDGRVASSFEAVSNANLFYRVQNPQGVTYWKYITALNDGDIIEVTSENLFIGDDEFTKTTTRGNNGNLADIYLPINSKGYLPLEEGETFVMNCFRNWLPVFDTISNNKEGVPDFHYEVTDENGDPSDLVTIVPDTYNSGVATMTAASGRTGTAIVKVTYDAMYIDDSRTYGPKFGAIWPERTGVFVVSVGEDGKSIQTNMKISQVGGSERDIDAEHDPLFYTGEAGASYSFTPEEGSEVTVARPALTESSLTYSGFTDSGVEKDAEGKVTVTGLVSGRNIIKVEKDGLATYQILTARKMSYTLSVDGETITDPKHIFEPGDVVTIVYSDLTSPSEKFSGKYNFNFRVGLEGENETKFLEASPGSFGVYNFTTKDHSLTVTIPADWTKDSYTVTGGGIVKGGFAGGDGTHRTSTYGAGGSMAWGSEGTGAAAYGSLPSITFTLKASGGHGIEQHGMDTLEKVEKKLPSFTENGVKEHWVCTECGRLFADEEGRTELESKDIEIPKLGFEVVADGEVIPADKIRIDATGYDASYADWSSGSKIEDIIPLATVTLPRDAKDVEVKLNNASDTYCTYYYTAEPDDTGYTQYVDMTEWGEYDESSYMYVAEAGTAYAVDLEQVIQNGNVIRVQTEYDADYVSHNLFAIAFETLPAKNGWQNEDGKWYFYENGVPKKGWIEWSGGKFYTNQNTGVMLTGWQKIGDDWYFFREGNSGRMLVNAWQKDTVDWCYLGADGKMVKNVWRKDSVDWCYLGADGRIVRNAWQQDSVGWCYLGDSGRVLRNKWLQWKGGWYYLKSDGYMAANEYVYDSKGRCWMTASGKWDGKYY